MESYIKGNQEREEFVKFIKKLERNKEFMNLLSKEENDRIIYGTEYEEIGIAKGEEIGKEIGKAEIVVNMYEAKMSIEEISNTTKIPIDKIKKILHLDKENCH